MKPVRHKYPNFAGCFGQQLLESRQVKQQGKGNIS